MSTTIDQRVVEMRFDNKQFEANVKTSLSTLDKLKQKLNLTGASKGLENINNAAKHHNLGVIGDAAYQVGLKFNGMYTIADQALRNITNSVQRTATNMVNALTIDPIKTGLQEYETQIGAVQTIMANTSHNGTTLDEVNLALDTLNTYADKTIYNFTEMTRNIGTFTAAGVDLQTSVESIQGIANLAAVSGSTSQQASTAMYQLSQALAAGKVSLMDWNSVVNAGMGGKVFQDALVRTSELLGTGAQGAIDMYGSFRESLTKGEWLTTEVLTETLKQFAGAYSEADLINQGFTEQQAKDIANMAVTAEEAATKVKTMTQLWDTLKESAQSGWTQTWELIIGDFEEAKELWTKISDVIGNFINKISETRNNLLGGALNSPWEKLTNKLDEAGVSADEFETKIMEVAKKQGVDVAKIESQYESFEDACRAGAFSSKIFKMALIELGQSTSDLSKITETLNFGAVGDDVKQAQEALKKLGHGTFDQFGIDGIIGEETTAAIKAFQEAQGLEVDGIIGPETLAALKEASSSTNKLTGDIYNLWNGIDELGGRELAIEGLKNVFNAFLEVVKPIKDAFRDIFPPATSEGLYNLIKGFADFTATLKPSDETIKAIYDTFKGLFSILDIGIMAVKAIGKGITKAFGNGTLGNIITTILKFTGAIGKFISSIRDGIKEGDSFSVIVDTIAGAINKILGLANIPADVIAGFVNGLSGGAGAIVSAAIEMVSKFLTTIKNFLGIHSPSTEMYDVAWNCILGLVNGIKAGIQLVIGAVGDIANSILAAFGLDWGKLLTIGLSGGFIYTAKKLFDVIQTFASPLEGLGDILGNAGETVDIFNDILKKSGKGIAKTINNFAKIEKSFAKMIKAKAWDLRATALLKFAGAIGILAASLALLTLVDQGNLWSAVGALSVMMIVMGAFAFAVSKLMTITSIADAAAIALLGNLLVKLGIAVAIMGLTIKLIGSMEPTEALQGLAAISVLMLFMKFFAEIGANSAGKNANKLGKMLLKLSIALLLMVGVCKLIGKLTPGEILGGIMALVVFGSFVAIMAEFTAKAGDNVSKFGRMMLSLSISMLLMVGVVKLLGMLSLQEIVQGGLGILGLVGIMALMVTVVKTVQKDIPKLASVLMSMSLSMLIMAAVVGIIGSMKLETIVKGGIGLLAFVGIMALMVAIVKSIEKDAPKVAATLIAMSIAIGILGGVAVILSLIDPIGLAKGVAAVGVLTLIFAMAAKSARGVGEAKDTFIGMAVAIGVMAAAVALLTFVDTGKLIVASACLGILMLAFSKIAAASKDVSGGFKSLIVMTVAIGVLAGILALLTLLPMDEAIGTSIAISILMLAMSVGLKAVSKVGADAMKALPAMFLMGLVVAEIGLVIGIINSLGIQTSIQTVVSLSILLLAMSAATLILSKIGGAAGPAIVGALAVMAVIAIIGLTALAIGDLMNLLTPEQLEAAKTGLQGFMDLLVILGQGLGDAVGAFLGGAIGETINQVATSVTTLGDAIGGMATKLKESGVDDSAIQAATNIGLMMAAISGANLMDNISKFLGGEVAWDTIGTKLDSFATAVVDFSSKISGKIDDAAIESATKAGTMFAELANSLPKSGGIWQSIAGEQDIGAFGAKIKAFAEAMVGVNEVLSGEGFTVNETAMTALVTAGTKFSELEGSLPKQGGLWQSIAGSADISAFGAKIVAFTSAVLAVNDMVSAEGLTINETAMTALTTAGTKFSELEGSLPKSGGLWQSIAGEADISTFGAKIKAFAAAVLDVNTAVSGEGFSINSEAIDALVTAGTKFAELESVIPQTGGWWSKIAGEEDIGDFGKRINTFGEKMVSFTTTIADFDNSKMTTVMYWAGRLCTFATDAVELDTSGIKEFEKVEDIASAMSTFNYYLTGIDTEIVSSAITSANRLKSLITSLVGLDTSGVDTFKDAINKFCDINLGDLSVPDLSGLGSSVISSIVSGVKSKASEMSNVLSNAVNDALSKINSAKESFKTAGVALTNMLIVGMLEKVGMIKLAVTTAMSSAVSAINLYYESFKSAGKYVGDGLIAGLNAKKQEVYDAGYALGKKAKEGMKDGSGVQSPSIYGIETGEFIGEGLIIGMGHMIKSVYKSGKNLGQTASNAMTSTVSKIATAINTDIDSQPTIRPVLDLSDVQSGAGRIGNMLSGGYNLAVGTNMAGTIAANMNSRQNGTSMDDVVSAIDKLRNNLSGNSGPTYQVGGVTYDDGTNVATAVKSLIRAAKIDRRA